jgi:hypothetical protein
MLIWNLWSSWELGLQACTTIPRGVVVFFKDSYCTIIAPQKILLDFDCDKYKQFKSRDDLFWLMVSWFQSFQFRVSWIHCFEPEVRQGIMAAGVYGRGCQEAERDRKGLGTRYPSKAAPSDLLSPARPHLLKFPPPPQTSATSWAQVFNTWTCGHFLFKPQQKRSKHSDSVKWRCILKIQVRRWECVLAGVCGWLQACVEGDRRGAGVGRVWGTTGTPELEGSLGLVVCTSGRSGMALEKDHPLAQVHPV